MSKIQLNNIGQSGVFLDKLLGSLLKAALSLIENVLKPLAKSVLIPLVLTAASSATDAAIHKKSVWIRFYKNNNFKWRNEWYCENS